MIPAQHDSPQFESLAKVYYQDGDFNEAFIRATFYNLDPKIDATLDIIGEVPLPAANIPIVFDGKGMGHNVTHMRVIVPARTAGVLVCWTRYKGFEWNKDQ